MSVYTNGWWFESHFKHTDIVIKHKPSAMSKDDRYAAVQIQLYVTSNW